MSSESKTYTLAPEPNSLRRCGDCQLCCRLLPVQSLGKLAGKRCRHQSFAKGCGVYANLMRVSPECHVWNCRWLVHDDTDDLRRPDRSGYVLDVMPDFVEIVSQDGTQRYTQEVAQVWVDPSRRDAHRDPALRAYLDRHKVFGLVRYSESEALVIIPPSVSGEERWIERDSNIQRRAPHTFAEVAHALSGAPS